MDMDSLNLWYQKIARPLPWRENHDPYRIWVSEIMLQQTQVETVISYYLRFLKRFPSLKSLAESDEQEVLTLWSGLGYYRRAKNLRKGAQYLLSLRGEFPRTRDEILRVPGIGPYTAGAILSIAFDLPEALVDGNVQRVFARYFGFQESVQSSKAQKFFWSKAQTWVNTATSPRIHNQALMELGSLICKKGTPLCHQCPIKPSCVAFKKNLQQKLPIPKNRKPSQEVHWLAAVFHKTLRGKDLYWLKQNIGTQWWDGLWEFPRVDKPLKQKWNDSVKFLEKTYGKDFHYIPLNHAQHSVTHHKIRVAPYLIHTSKIPSPIDGKWLTPDQISQLPLSALAKKIFRQLPMC